MWAADKLVSRAWHTPPYPSIVGSTYVLLMHVILRGNRSTPTGGGTPSILPYFLTFPGGETDVHTV